MYLAGNKYNPNVELVKSDVFKKELAAKQYFRAPEVKAHLIGRGFERFDLDRLQELFDIMYLHGYIPAILFNVIRL